MVNQHKQLNPFVCTGCSKAYPRFNQYKRHTNECHKETYSCDLCARKFTSKSLLSRHLNTRHNENREKLFPCPNCNRSFRSEPAKKLHIRRFCLVNRIHDCKRCHTVFPTKEELVKHGRLANECSKRYLCSECGQRYVRNEDLIKHLRLHTGELPFKCNYCDKGTFLNFFLEKNL